MSNWLIYKGINLLKSTTNVSIFNFLTNNNDIVYICPNLYLGNVKSAQNTELLKKHNINSIVNCTKDIPIHSYFKIKSYYRIDIEDSKELSNIEEFKSKIIDAAYFINEQINDNKNVIVHCYWGLMRSPTVIGAYLIMKYHMSTEDVIKFIQEKKCMTFSNIYNFKSILLEFEKYCEDFNI